MLLCRVAKCMRHRVPCMHGSARPRATLRVIPVPRAPTCSVARIYKSPIHRSHPFQVNEPNFLALFETTYSTSPMRNMILFTFVLGQTCLLVLMGNICKIYIILNEISIF
jgi:hypothetical protein